MYLDESHTILHTVSSGNFQHSAFYEQNGLFWGLCKSQNSSTCIGDALGAYQGCFGDALGTRWSGNVPWDYRVGALK